MAKKKAKKASSSSDKRVYYTNEGDKYFEAKSFTSKTKANDYAHALRCNRDLKARVVDKNGEYVVFTNKKV